MKGQSSFETLVTVSFLFSLLAVTFSAASGSFSELKSSQDIVASKRQIRDFAREIDSIYLQGYPSGSVKTLSFPFGSEPGIDCDKGSLWVELRGVSGNNVVFSTFSSPCEFNGTLSSGRYEMKSGDVVEITRLD
jgi:hypothetical protein